MSLQSSDAALLSAVVQRNAPAPRRVQGGSCRVPTSPDPCRIWAMVEVADASCFAERGTR